MTVIFYLSLLALYILGLWWVALFSLIASSFIVVKVSEFLERRKGSDNSKIIVDKD